jgi:phosphomannomutase
MTHLDSIDPTTFHHVQAWLEGPYDEETKAEIRKMLQHDLKELIDAFYTSLSFGTGGLRGLMGIGSNRMNAYTVAQATQGLANVLKLHNKPSTVLSTFIGYDSRHHSREFAEICARVLAGNCIHVHLCKEIRPTPLVSFGCQALNCHAGIMITASHNPPQYNGYKLFWFNGSQILPPLDQQIIEEINKISSPLLVNQTNNLESPFIHEVGEEIDQAYLDAIVKLQNYPIENATQGHKLKVVYTSLHGTGITLLPKALASWGFYPTLVDAQIIPDGNFPTIDSPNPEDPQTLQMGLDKLDEIKGDLLIATDPDADRIGIGALHQGQIHVLNGNQIASLCLYHICRSQTALGTMHPKSAFIKTIATTELFQAICDSFNKPCFNVLTGFKYIAEKIQQWQSNPNGYQYIFGGEESHGYLYGTCTRDKDAITVSTLLCEAALQLKLQGKTFIDLLHEIYQQYGYYHEKLLSIHFEESKEGKTQIKEGMERLQNHPPHTIFNIPVESLEDYRRSVKIYLHSGKTEFLTLPKSDILLFWLQDGTKLMIRPSGTEPKIKIYCGLRKEFSQNLTELQKECELHAKNLCEALRLFIDIGKPNLT